MNDALREDLRATRVLPEDGARPKRNGATEGAVDRGISKWLASESWGQTLIGAARDSLVGWTILYAGVRLGVFGPSWWFVAPMVVAIPLIGVTLRRSAWVTMPRLLIVMSGGLIALSVVLVGAAVRVGEYLLPALGVLAITVGGGVIAFRFASKAESAVKAFEDGVAQQRVAPVLLTRAELRGRVNRFLEAGRAAGNRYVRMVLGVSGTLAVINLFPYDRVFGGSRPIWLSLVTLAGAVGAGVWAAIIARRERRRARSEAEHHGLICPACDEPLLGGYGNRRLMNNLADAGLCPQCGTRIVKEDS